MMLSAIDLNTPLQLLEQAAFGEEFRERLQYLNACVEGLIPNYDIDLSRIQFLFHDIELGPLETQVTRLQHSVLAFLQDQGFRGPGQYLTVQELTCIGGTGYAGNVSKKSNAIYQPFGVSLGEITLSEARRARELVGQIRLSIFPEDLFDDINTNLIDLMKKGQQYFLTLEELSGDGVTEQDPRLIAPDYSVVSEASPRADFPFRRP